MPDDPIDKYDYKRFGSNAKRVGQAVYDILKQGSQPTYTTEDIIDGYQHEYVKEFEKCIEHNKDKYDNPFYILVLSHKEHWAENVMRNWFIARQTAPSAYDMICQFANHMKTLYKIDNSGELKVEWTLPGIQDIRSILNHPDRYDPILVKYCANAIGISVD